MNIYLVKVVADNSMEYTEDLYLIADDYVGVLDQLNRVDIVSIEYFAKVYKAI